MSNPYLIHQVISYLEKEVEDMKNITFKIGDFNNQFAIGANEKVRNIYSKIEERKRLIKGLKEILGGK